MRQVWRAFRAPVLWAALITAAVWITPIILGAWQDEEPVAAGTEELPALAPSGSEQVFLVLAIGSTFAFALVGLVAYSLLRSRTRARRTTTA